jgi:plasmid stability protein
MAMTVRFDEEETRALRKRAAVEGRSMQEITRAGVREYIDRHSRDELLDEVLAEDLPRFAEALDRLGR